MSSEAAGTMDVDEEVLKLQEKVCKTVIYYSMSNIATS